MLDNVQTREKSSVYAFSMENKQSYLIISIAYDEVTVRIIALYCVQFTLRFQGL